MIQDDLPGATTGTPPPRRPSPVRTPRAIWFLYGCAIYSFARSHVANTFRYMSLPNFLAGTERLPYQRRLLVMLVLRALHAVPLYRTLDRSMYGRIVPPGLFSFFLVDLVSLAAAAWFCQKLYRRAATTPWATPFVAAMLLVAAAWTYMLAPEGSVFYPYDLPSLAFFTAGLYFIYSRQLPALLLTVLVGTLNRETTIFLVPLYLLDAAVHPDAGVRLSRWRRLPWIQAVALTAIWLLVKFALSRLYTQNDAADEHLRLRENLHLLLPNKWPELLGTCGFLLPVVLAYRRRISDLRIRAFLLIVPLWIAVMFVYGVLSEVRVFGELCSLVTVAAALLLDSYIESTQTRQSESIPLSL